MLSFDGYCGGKERHVAEACDKSLKDKEKRSGMQQFEVWRKSVVFFFPLPLPPHSKLFYLGGLIYHNDIDRRISVFHFLSLDKQVDGLYRFSLTKVLQDRTSKVLVCRFPHKDSFEYP